MMFGDKRYYRELLHNSMEGIASNILADRLQRLVANGLVSRAPDPTHKQKIRYSLTEPAIQLVPIMAHLGTWGNRHLPVSRELAVRAELLEAGGPELWDQIMDELRERHLGVTRPAGAESVLATSKLPTRPKSPSNRLREGAVRADRVHASYLVRSFCEHAS